MASRLKIGLGSRQPCGSKPSVPRLQELFSPRTLDSDTESRLRLQDADIGYLQVARVLLPPPGGHPHSIPTPVATLAFDTSQELLWAANEYGRVTSFYGTDLQRYTSFKAHPSSDGPVRQLLFNEKGVIALGAKGVHMASRKGPPIWHISHEDMKDLRCMSYTSKATSEILVAGLQDTMFVIDVNKGEVVKRVPTTDHYILMKKSRYICAATKDGNVNILDTTKLNLIQKWRAHSSYINDMDVQQDFIVTCGASYKQQAATTYMLDPYVNVFDLKNMSVMSPIPFPPLAAYVRMHPRMVTTGIVVSQGGQMHVVDLLNPNTSNVRQANVLSYVTMIEIAPSGEAIALADTECYMHLWGSPSKIHFAEFATPVEFPDTEEPQAQITWAADTPLNSIGMPYYRETLLSAWPSTVVSDVGAPPVRYDPSYIASLQSADFGLYGRNTRGLRRNQVEDTRSSDKSSNTMQAPKFLSEKARESAKASGISEAKIEEIVDSLATTELESLKPDVPAMYRNVEIKYSKFGVDDFDFGFYNKTRYAGLENHIVNSYANSLLQVMHFTPLIRNLALQHAATACISDQCLLCELGYLSDMLQKAEGSTCQATNMFKCLTNHPQAGPLGLLEDDARRAPLATMIQHLTRFLLDRMARDFGAIMPANNDMEQILATSALTSIRCMNCRSETTRPGSTYVNELLYPANKNSRGGRATKITFSQVLKASVERETTNKGWCNRCNRYQSLATRKTIHSVPAVLTLNAQATSPEHRMLWATPGWLPEEIGIIVDQGQFFCYEGEDLKLHLQRGIHHIMVYSLIGMSVNIESGPPQKPHLVGLVNVAHAEPTAPAESQWHLFNDFSVRSVSKQEALTFNTTWKTPSVIMYQLKSANNQLDTTWKSRLDTSILSLDFKSNAGEKTYRVLDLDTEKPGPDTIIGIDTEFVAVKQPEIEMNSEGERETIRPMIYALARVSAVRGMGEDEGLPFIDDYIEIKEPISDYLTLYSGITHGDLDPRTTKHNLVSLKIAYKKLWILLNLGCKFLGHGLKQDFRVINIQVPKAQIIDTINLFFLQSRLRKLSLAFLAWYLLKEDIQLETHDSIEDARTALKLYRKYLEFEDAGILETMLQDIYRAGRDTNYKPPRKDDLPVQRTDTPPIPIEDRPGPSTPARRAAAVPGQVAPPTSFGNSAAFTPGKGSPLR